MKHIFTSILCLILAGGLMAQANVTFEVDMSAEMVDMNGIHVAGNFWDWNGDGTVDNPAISANWLPDLPELMLTDDDTDGVYSITLSLVPGNYEFKFINGNVWDNAEDVPPTCQVEVTGNDNRFLMVGEDDASYHVCWASCAACGDYAVRFRVDMSLQEAVSPNGVHVAGEFQGWSENATPLMDSNEDNIWEGVYTFDASILDDGLLTFKYINGNDWANPNEYVTEDCGDGTGNRTAAITDLNTPLDIVCFDACDACTQPTAVTLRVDMSNEAEVSTNGVHVAGNFQGWNTGGTPLTDMGDGIWEVTVNLAPGAYEYKFLNGNAWTEEPDEFGNIGNESPVGDCTSNGNRALTVGEEPMTDQWCYNQCSESCVADPDPADITFQVDMTEIVDAGELSSDGVWLMGNFTEPNWQAGAVPMTDADGNNIFEATVLVDGSADIQFKFTNGDPYPAGEIDASVEENNDFEAGGCGVGNGIGGFNRTHTRSGEAEVLAAVCYNACEACGVNIDETLNGRIAAFPNPVNEVLNLQVPAGTQVIVFDVAGREVAAFNTNASVDQIDVRGWDSGVYVAQLLHNGVAGQLRFVKK
ncbi:MAG: T9SS type A sorting domain-containing protein [Flavobacteriales bacterium]